jgi:hypothetical protein
VLVTKHNYHYGDFEAHVSYVTCQRIPHVVGSPTCHFVQRVVGFRTNLVNVRLNVIQRFEEFEKPLANEHHQHKRRHKVYHFVDCTAPRPFPGRPLARDLLDL